MALVGVLLWKNRITNLGIKILNIIEYILLFTITKFDIMTIVNRKNKYNLIKLEKRGDR